MRANPASILIADDDPLNRKLLIRLLEQDGHHVRAAENGNEALQLFSQEPSDLILLDIVMPELDGVSVLERLKERSETQHIPVIMISAVDEVDSVETSDSILEHGGTLVAYRGDGFLAVFGAPIEVEDHADRALATARDMLRVRLPRFNEWIRREGLGEEIGMGVGLNSGPFMSGNVGSLRRLEYTVHGDTVNTASRIEGMTKSVGSPILVAESTRQSLLRPPDDLQFLGDFEVRGRTSTISLWTVDGASRSSGPSGATTESPAPPALDF